MPDPVASILIPAFRAATTLPLAIGSALRQTVRDVEIIVIGDGVDDATRSAARDAVGGDDRVRFLDLPKGDNRGEVHRHTGVLEARSNAILYLADDDLLLPDHVKNMLELLETSVFVQSRNGFIDAEDRLQLFPADLADPLCIAWHLKDPPRNAVSITGTAHSRQFYLELDEGWTVTPPGIWTDLYMWRKFFRHPDFSGATHPAMTTLQFPAALHMHRDPEDLHAMMVRWDAFTRRADVRAEMSALLQASEERELVSLSAALVDLRTEVADILKSRDELAAQLEAVHGTRSWRWTAPLRRMMALFRST